MMSTFERDTLAGLAVDAAHLDAMMAVIENWRAARLFRARVGVDGMLIERSRDLGEAFMDRSELGLRREMEVQLAAHRVAGQIVIEYPTRWFVVGMRSYINGGGVDLDVTLDDHRLCTRDEILNGRFRQVADLFIGEASAIVIPPVRGAHRHG